MNNPIVAILSVYTERDNIDYVIKAINELKPTSTSSDTQEYDFAGELGVAQGYFHIETDNYAMEIKSRRAAFVRLHEKLAEKHANEGSFIAFAEHWFCEPKTLFPHDFRSSTRQYETERMNKTYPNGDMAAVFFVERPSYRAPISTAITIVEVPQAIQTNLALELAHHKSDALKCILCAVDLLASKISRLGRIALAKFDKNPKKVTLDLLSPPVSAPQTGSGKVLSEADILRPLTSTSVLLTTLEMTKVMLEPVEHQLSHFTNALFKDATQLEGIEASAYPPPISAAIADATSLRRMLTKYIGILRGIREIHLAKNSQVSSERNSVLADLEKKNQHRFNLLTLLLAGAAVALAMSTLVDNESAKAIIDWYTGSQDWQKLKSSPPLQSHTVLIVLFVKVALSAGVTIVVCGVLWLVHFVFSIDSEPKAGSFLSNRGKK